jgi:very-short-patch-repair endonuclease
VREARQIRYVPAMSRRIRYDDTQRARDLRNNATRHERKLWAMISRLRPKFTRQLPIGPYFADFACRQAKLIVELDGSQHAESERDQRRDAFLSQEGWTVLRIWNKELDENAEGVMEAIMNHAAECLGGTHPQPLPSREGRASRRRFG